MGKKVRKEPETPSKETFDPLSIESKKAATVILMLSSTEEEVLAKACEAILRYAEKGDENKSSLVGLGVMEPLCHLLSHGDSLVSRNAVMALGVMASNNDVKGVLKKMDIIPSVISKLSPDGDVVVHEFATLCLAALSTEFTNKIRICDNNGLDPLINLLSSPDPDVQKNSLECIYNLVQDLPNCTAVCRLHGIPPLLHLLHSEFPVIQQLVLCTLERVTSDAEARSALRGEQGFHQLLELLSSREHSDLHAEALRVISNCLEDAGSLPFLQESGKLDQLLQFLASPASPEVLNAAAKAVSRMARSGENRKLLHEHDVESALVNLLATDNDHVRATACQAMTGMSENDASKDKFRQLDVIRAIVPLLANESGELREAAAQTLSRLTNGSPPNSQAVYEAEGVGPLVHLLQDPRSGAMAHAAAVLANMAAQEPLRRSILARFGMRCLVGPLQAADAHTLTSAALAVSALACDADGRKEFRNAGGLAPLVKLLSSKDSEIRRNACWAVRVCANDEPTATEMYKLGALEILQDINMSANSRNRFSEAAFQQLLDSNLSVKYSLGGQLTSSDITGDGFYDPGQARPGQRVLPLEDLARQHVNQHRPVIAVNGKPDYLISTESSDNKLQDVPSPSCSSTVLNKSGVRSPSKVRSKVRREEDRRKDKDESGPQPDTSGVKPWTQQCDADLHGLVLEASRTVSPLRDERDRCATLAKLVSDAMGGTVARDELDRFMWEIHLSELKLQLQSNVIPIGRIKKGTFSHRALLFKVLADGIGLSCSLERGEYNRAWNKVRLTEGPPDIHGCYCRPRTYIVDLMHSPGVLMRSDSPEAIRYQTI
ncbi:armadillo repeat-containing protein 3 isoform X1 [Brienomyrus brachyistius]|uniref:armadillo repeat-containing protein 3 isoform X1 n=1 Tax=Brienomyrus brachyistius TaxID=42636 RepID=UPI0020B307DB|nr:armadillo repeat-containing protein 3 isoform X1 [Brienomyrus brachyistius]